MEKKFLHNLRSAAPLPFCVRKVETKPDTAAFLRVFPVNHVHRDRQPQQNDQDTNMENTTAHRRSGHGTKHTQKKTRISHRADRQPHKVVVVYDIRPGN